MAEKTDLKRAYDALSGKKADYDTLFNYYDGDQPLTYTANRLSEIFKDLDAYFAENWCSVVIESCRDRVNLRKMQVSAAPSTASGEKPLSAQEAGRLQGMLDRWWDGLELSLESDEVHEACMVCGEAFVVAWEGTDPQAPLAPQGGEQIWPDAYFNDPRMVHLFYEADRPRVKKFGAKWWVDDDDKMRMTLYYPDRLEYYVSTQKHTDVSSHKGMKPADPPAAKNPYGEVPIFHFRMGRRVTKSDLGSVIPIQNGINKLLTDMMVTAEYGAFPQRYVISNAETPGKLKNAPNEVWDLPAGDGMGQQTQAGQFSAADLENYLKAIDNLATAISSITRTPKHYFFSVGSNLSGEALIAMEAPLNKKAQDRIERFGPVWQQVGAFLFKVAGADVGAQDIRPVFDTPETIQPRTEAETRDLNVRAGMALETVWRDEGKSEVWIEQAKADMKRQRAAEQASLGEALLNAQRQFGQAPPAPKSGENDGGEG